MVYEISRAVNRRNVIPPIENAPPDHRSKLENQDSKWVLVKLIIPFTIIFVRGNRAAG